MGTDHDMATISVQVSLIDKSTGQGSNTEHMLNLSPLNELWTLHYTHAENNGLKCCKGEVSTGNYNGM